MIVKALGHFLTMRVCQSVDLLAPLLPSVLGLGFAMRLVKASDQPPDHTTETVHKTRILVFQLCESLFVLNSYMACVILPISWPDF